MAEMADKQPATVRAVRLVILDASGQPLAFRVFDTPAALADILRIAPADGNAPPWHAPGITILGPGERAVVFVAELVPVRPAWAIVTVDVEGRRPARVSVPLDAYQPSQRLSLPVGAGDHPWIATATAGTAHHSQGGAVMRSGRVFVSQRFALGLRQVDEQLRTHPDDTSSKEAYYAWGAPVLSMGRGVVVAAVDSDTDHEIGEVIPATQHPAGNYIVIQQGPAAFAVYAHLQRGSVGVRVGQWVERGQPLASVGNSGSSSEPHLHVHVADRWRRDTDPFVTFLLGQGVPALFWRGHVWRDGEFLPLFGATPTEFDILVPDAHE